LEPDATPVAPDRIAGLRADRFEAAPAPSEWTDAAHRGDWPTRQPSGKNRRTMAPATTRKPLRLPKSCGTMTKRTNVNQRPGPRGEQPDQLFL